MKLAIVLMLLGQWWVAIDQQAKEQKLTDAEREFAEAIDGGVSPPFAPSELWKQVDEPAKPEPKSEPAPAAKPQVKAADC